MKRKIVRGSLFVAAAALATSGLVATPAHAATSQTCKTLKGAVTIKPGISTVPRAQTANAKANATKCTVAGKTGGSGVMTATLKLPADSSCTGLIQGGTSIKMKAKITWKNKKTSALALTAKTGTGDKVLVATITGKVASGLFKGRPVTSQIKIAPAAGQDCVTKPVTKITFTNSKPFVIK